MTGGDAIPPGADDQVISGPKGEAWLPVTSHLPVPLELVEVCSFAWENGRFDGLPLYRRKALWLAQHQAWGEPEGNDPADWSITHWRPLNR